MENITASEVAGFGVGTLLLCATIAAPKIDSFISGSQRSSLGMCKRCGDVKLIACRDCRGVGSTRPGEVFGFDVMGDLLDGMSAKSSSSKNKSSINRIPCSKCQSRGHFKCSDCSIAPPSSSASESSSV